MTQQIMRRGNCTGLRDRTSGYVFSDGGVGGGEGGGESRSTGSVSLHECSHEGLHGLLNSLKVVVKDEDALIAVCLLLAGDLLRGNLVGESDDTLKPSACIAEPPVTQEIVQYDQSLL